MQDDFEASRTVLNRVNVPACLILGWRTFHKATSDIRFDSCGRNTWLTTCRKDFEFRHGVLKVEITWVEHGKTKAAMGTTVLEEPKRPGRSVG